MKTTKDISNDLPLLAKGKYCISTGNKLIHHLTYRQLKSMYSHILHFQEMEKLSFPETTDHHENEIEIQKVIYWEENQDGPVSAYCISGRDCEIQMVSYSAIKKIAETLQVFLKECPEESTPANPEEEPNNIPISVWKDKYPEIRHPVFYTTTSISKRIFCDGKKQSIHTRYILSVNELCSSWLSSQQLAALCLKLYEFLNCKKR